MRRTRTMLFTFTIVAALFVALGLAREAQAQLIEGTGGADTLVGTTNADTIKAFAGDDIVLAKDGKDVVWGGKGADQIASDNGVGDALHGDDGADFLDGVTHNCSRYYRVFDGGPGEDTAVFWPDQYISGGGHNSFNSIEHRIPIDPFNSNCAS